MKTYILYNPLAGHSETAEQRKALAARYEDEVQLLDVTEIEDYGALLSPLGAEDKVILCGGDGTLNRFVNAIDGLDVQCDILYHADGTGNDFLKDLDKEPGCEPFSVKPYIENLPVVEIDGKRSKFINGIGFGIDGYCCEVGDQMKAKSTKPVNYTAIAIKGLLFHYKPKNATVVVDGKTYHFKKAWIAATMKGRYYGGGMMNAPDQDRLADDGEVTVVLFYGKGKLKTLMAFPSIFKGEHVKKTHMVAAIKGKNVKVTFDAPSALQIDGETVLNVTEYSVTAKAKAKLAEPQTV